MLTVLLATTTSRRWTCASRVSTGPRTRPRCSQHNSIAASALRCGRRRPRQPGAARGAVFESMRLREGQAGALELKAALRSAVELARSAAAARAIQIVRTPRLHQFGDQCGDLRRALAELVIICEIETLELPPNLFCLKSSVRSRIRLRSADARLGRPWPELGGMADQAAPGHRGRGAQFRARLGRRARFLIAVYCCARWRHARRRARSVCKQTLREPRMYRPARALISALSRTPRASLGTLSSRPKTLGRLKDACAS